ncbi:MAG: alkaline phosphatase family protein [Deltaproteobacteria bacterium]|nr:alkaline phosphatase family protein [Deltaproteobacteria bacterium]
MNEKDSGENRFSRLGRRPFLRICGALLGGALLSGKVPRLHGRAFAGTGETQNPVKGERSHRRLIYIAIDALHPKYLELNSKGQLGGKDGDWLMPSMRAFLNRAVWYPEAKAYLPAATDMNHLNALAGTSMAQNGIIGVWAQPVGWDEKGKAIIRHSHLSMARDDQGRPVDTLFHAWKRRWPGSKTLFITGKEWVGEMFRQPAAESGVDIVVTGAHFPPYLQAPQKESFADPLTDTDGACDPESGSAGFFGWKELRWGNLLRHFSPSTVMSRLWSGQGGLLTRQMVRYPEHFPHDRWIVDSTLEIFRQQDPDMAYILMAQTDDAGHCVGCGWDPSEFVVSQDPVDLAKGCEMKPEYAMVSGRNPLLFREPILDVIRDVDIQFGRLMKGFEEQGILQNATIILLSDHSAVNHLYSEDFSSTDVMAILEKGDLVENGNVYAFSVSSYGVIYWRDRKEQVPAAKDLLLKHRAWNPQTKTAECPWWVLDRRDMKEGVKDICLPGELYHTYFVETDREKSMIWPDLIVLAKNGWQIPAYNGHVPNVGVQAPSWTPAFRVYNGGHGSVDTLPIVAAIAVPGGKQGIHPRPIRIGDLGATAAALMELELRSTVIGQDLSRDLVS